VWIGICDGQRNFATRTGGDDALQMGVLTTRRADEFAIEDIRKQHR
jgi:hypothetical protein